ncbi:uncharacterized protein EI90DRAFT_2137094 [Cantharellus anzutake]|uniref:uncharacterized protein n=1 Tax=Cantharellus anzutake TaxID=1750568 RepID=UPI001908472A|nr:uncharacterized protein EI90DRAFT_2137094 [Cantharellus anzutake]KAF8325391.1 hypothetical protein EI90DRAFT_2137094 [Cantharellus anzutake]
MQASVRNVLRSPRPYVLMPSGPSNDVGQFHPVSLRIPEASSSTHAQPPFFGDDCPSFSYPRAIERNTDMLSRVSSCAAAAVWLQLCGNPPNRYHACPVTHVQLGASWAPVGRMQLPCGGCSCAVILPILIRLISCRPDYYSVTISFIRKDDPSTTVLLYSISSS